MCAGLYVCIYMHVYACVHLNVFVCVGAFMCACVCIVSEMLYDWRGRGRQHRR